MSFGAFVNLICPHSDHFIWRHFVRQFSIFAPNLFLKGGLKRSPAPRCLQRDQGEAEGRPSELRPALPLGPTPACHGPAEPKRIRTGLDNVRVIGQPVKYGLA
jgi:hypothetical protein